MLKPPMVRHRKVEADATILDSFEINAAVRSSVRALSALGYNHDGRGGLPLRYDVTVLVYSVLCSASATPGEGPVLWAGGCNAPSVTLNHDGTLTIAFVEDLRCLKLDVKCRDVVLYSRIFEDGVTVIEGTLPSGREAATDELQFLVTWLLEGTL